MSDSKPRSFWGRVTEFVKNPTQDWSLTRHENALRDLQEQEQVKAKEEQRKLDAFIRRRELASLRRLRKRQADGLPIDEGYTDIPDTGTGTGPSAPEREATLRKINEIEQSMVQDSKPGLRAKTFLNSRPIAPPSMLAAEGAAIRLGDGSTAPPPSPTDPGAPLTFPATDVYSRTQGSGGQAMPPTPPRTQGDIDATVPAPTQMAPTQMANASSAGTLMGLGMTQIAAEMPPMDTWMKAGGGYTSSSPMAVDVQEGVSSSPLFDQACIDFANGQDADAERALLDAISGSPDRDLENEFWLALFDLYRASHNTTKFEALVNDYVDRFQTSAPSWGLATTANKTAGHAGAPLTSTAATVAADPPSAAAFTALGELDTSQSRALLLLARGNAKHVTLDFTGLTSIAQGAQTFAMEALKTLNTSNGCAVELIGINNLIEACAESAPPMQRDADPAWWGLRLEALRLAGGQEPFENAALDYCVTYEISPPTWEPSKAKVRIVAAEASAGYSRPATTPQLGHPTSQFSTHFGNTGPGMALAALRGEIKGGSEDFLKPLDQATQGHSAVIVDLSELRRLDFASAGIMLNWVMSQSSAGRSVQFEGTHRLIAGLFIILGINSVAQIQLRKF